MRCVVVGWPVKAVGSSLGPHNSVLVWLGGGALRVRVPRLRLSRYNIHFIILYNTRIDNPEINPAAELRSHHVKARQLRLLYTWQCPTSTLHDAE